MGILGDVLNEMKDTTKEVFDDMAKEGKKTSRKVFKEVLNETSKEYSKAFALAWVRKNPKNARSISQSTRIRIALKAHFKCQKCGKNLKRTPELIEFDHIRPVAKGGSGSLKNLQLLCRKCNREKGAKY